MVTADYLEVKIMDWGEVFVVLDSGEEYIIHGDSGYERSGDVFRVEGLRDGEWIVAEFPVSAVEHVYTHKEV